MTTLLITLLLAIVIVAVVVYAIDLIGVEPRLAQLLKLCVVVVALIVVLTRVV